MEIAISQNLDLTQVPLSALKQSTMVTLSTSLNQHKIIPTNDGLPRDWRGLAQLIGLNGTETNQISTKPDCFSALMEYWGAKGNIFLLQEYLRTIDRYDVLDDTKLAIVRDSIEYEERLKTVNNTATKKISLEGDKRVLTVDDAIRLEKGMEPQIYDAYILYAEEDTDFAVQIVETMEKKYNFKLCVRDRDLIGGVQFEHDAIIKLIAERCRRLIIVVTSNFLKSKANKFFVTFAQALGIDIRERKVIPVLYERCEVPPELSYYFLLDYNRAGKLWNFWDKLRDSIQAPESCQITSLRSATDSTGVKPKNDLWISRTHFEHTQNEPESKPTEISENQIKPKTSNIYKLIKSSLSKGKKSSGSPQRSSEASLLNLVSADEKLSDIFSHTCNLDMKDEPGGKEKNKKVKKKWYKKKAVESLLT